MTTDGFVSTDAGVRLFVRTVGGRGSHVLIPGGMHLVDDFAHLADGRTLVFYDLRNRGRSDAVTDPALLAAGVACDVDDIDAVRRHVGAERVDLIGHSYVGLIVILYAQKYANHARRIVQIGPVQPDQSATYPPEWSNRDETYQRIMTAIGALQKERAAYDPIAFCRRFWDVLRPLYVTDPSNAERVRWDRCELANERGMMRYWLEHIVPSMQRLTLTRDTLAGVTAPVVTIHGTSDRSSPFGAGRDWVALLPDARLVAVEGAGHAPWVEDSGTVFGTIGQFLEARG